MKSKVKITPKQLASVLFIVATFALFAGLFLSAIQPVSAQTGTTGTATAAVPVTGQNGSTTGANANRSLLATSTLKGWTVVDMNGTQIGTVDSLLLDLRNAAVCAPSTQATSAVGTPVATVAATSAVGTSMVATGTPAVGVSTTSTPVVGLSTPTTSAAVPNTGGTYMGYQACQVSNANQASGTVSYVVVDHSGVANTGTAVSTPVATATSAVGAVVGTPAAAATSAVGAVVGTPTSTVAGVAATPLVQATSTSSVANVSSGNLVPVPWNFVRLNLDQHTVIVDATASAFNNAPGFASDTNVPDLYTAPWSTNLSSFWNNSTNVSGGIPNTGATATVAATSPVVSTSTPVVAATVAPTATSVGVGGVSATATSVGVSATATTGAVSTVSAPGVNGTPTALVPVTGVDLSQVQEAAAAQQHMILDIGIVGVGLVLLALGIIIKTGKS